MAGGPALGEFDEELVEQFSDHAIDKHFHQFPAEALDYEGGRATQGSEYAGDAKGIPRGEGRIMGWGFCVDGYFVRTVGDQVTTEVIRRYIRFHKDSNKRPEQLRKI